MGKGNQTMAEMSIPIIVDWESIKDHLAKADIVEVIRCKECKWHKPKYPGERPTCLIYLGDWHDYDYCSRAERKQDDA